MLRLLVCLVPLVSTYVQLVCGESFLSLKFLTFTNQRGRGRNGQCCDGKSIFCFSACDHSFYICVDSVSGSPHNVNSCAYGRYVSKEISNKNSIVFGNTIGVLSNPILVRMNSWPGRVQLKVDIVDVDDHNRDDDVDFLQRILTLQANGVVNRHFLANRVSLNLEVQVYCGKFYFGSDCATYCQMRDDTLGHYNCNQQDGSKICLTGWTGLNCEISKNSCVGNPCQNGGRCLNNEVLFSFTCQCPPGFRGQRCEVDIDECLEASPCVLGRCVNNQGSYTCVCPAGYTDPHCSTNIDDCASRPCQNGATCTDQVDDFQCLCPATFTGKQCDTDVDECHTKPCKNNGTCTNFVGHHRCECLPGYHGNDCSLDVDECMGFPCRNGASCVNSIGGFSCGCLSGFQGSRCEFDINECETSNSSLCQNGGQCNNTLGHYVCLCPPGYSGDACQTDLDECLGGPCQHGSVCHDLPGDYTCECQRGYTGKNCENNIDECLLEVCLNGGNCTDLEGSFVCSCPVFWTGETCEANINECFTDPCVNGGTCGDVEDGFHCLCPAEFVGPHCEGDLDECELPDTCDNNATCVNEFGNFTCICTSGWAGKYCDEDRNECLEGICHHTGSCTNLPGGFRCDCPVNWQGSRCEEDIDECSSDVSPCRNNATCHNVPGMFYCECTDEWTGSLCDIDVDECQLTPDICRQAGNVTNQNNSSDSSNIFCVNTSPSYHCACDQGWAGEFCSEDLDECQENPDICSDFFNEFVNGGETTDKNIPIISRTTCVNTFGSYNCTCAVGWSGQNCDVELNEEYLVTTTPVSRGSDSRSDFVHYSNSPASEWTNYTTENSNVYHENISTTSHDVIVENASTTDSVIQQNISSFIVNTSEATNILTTQTSDVLCNFAIDCSSSSHLSFKNNSLHEQISSTTDFNTHNFTYSSGKQGQISEKMNPNPENETQDYQFSISFKTTTEEVGQETSDAALEIDTHNKNTSDTGISLPFYLECQISGSNEWTIDRGLIQMIKDTFLFPGKDIIVSHISENRTSETGKKVISIYPSVRVNGKLLADHEVIYILNKMAHRVSDYLHCPLFRDAIAAHVRFSAFKEESRSTDWYPGLITAVVVLIVVVAVVVIVKFRRQIKAFYHAKLQKSQTGVSIINPVYVPADAVKVGEEPEKNNWTMDDRKFFNEDDELNNQPIGANSPHDFVVSGDGGGTLTR